MDKRILIGAALLGGFVIYKTNKTAEKDLGKKVLDEVPMQEISETYAQSEIGTAETPAPYKNDAVTPYEVLSAGALPENDKIKIIEAIKKEDNFQRGKFFIVQITSAIILIPFAVAYIIKLVIDYQQKEHPYNTAMNDIGITKRKVEEVNVEFENIDFEQFSDDENEQKSLRDKFNDNFKKFKKSVVDKFNNLLDKIIKKPTVEPFGKFRNELLFRGKTMVTFIGENPLKSEEKTSVIFSEDLPVSSLQLSILEIKLLEMEEFGQNAIELFNKANVIKRSIEYMEKSYEEQQEIKKQEEVKTVKISTEEEKEEVGEKPSETVTGEKPQETVYSDIGKKNVTFPEETEKPTQKPPTTVEDIQYDIDIRPEVKNLLIFLEFYRDNISQVHRKSDDYENLSKYIDMLKDYNDNDKLIITKDFMKEISDKIRNLAINYLNTDNIMKIKVESTKKPSFKRYYNSLSKILDKF